MYPLMVQNSGCNKINNFGSPSCAAAMQKVCSSPERGGAGMSQELGPDYLSIACVKASWQGNVGISQLQNYNSRCNSPSLSQSSVCLSAIQSYCQAKHSINAGMAQGTTAQSVNIACFRPKWSGKVAINTLKQQFSRCNQSAKAEKSGCMAAVHRYCRSSHSANAGVIQSVSADSFGVACYSPTIFSNVPFDSNVAFASLQRRNQIINYTSTPQQNSNQADFEEEAGRLLEGFLY